MADDKNKQPAEQGNGTAANKENISSVGDVFETAREYKRTKEAQEILEKSLQQDAQEDSQTYTIRIDTSKVSGYDAETGAIIINGEVDPKLDPNSPQFDPVLYKEYAAAANERLKASLEQMRSTLAEATQGMISSETMQSLVSTVQESLAPMLESIGEAVKGFLSSDIYKSIGDTVRYIIDNNEAIKERLDEWEQLQPYLEEELKKPQYAGRTLDDLLANEYKDENGDILEDSLLEQAVEAAKAAMLAKELPIITINSRGVNNVEYPLDKINANIWTLLKDADKNGQLAFAAEKRGSSKTADIIYSINFEELEQETGVTITKKLTAFDKRCYIAASALFNNGFEVLTVAQLYAAMGNSGRPSAADIKKINDSLTKMRAAHIYLNNESEHKLYPKYSKFVYDASLLPMERISAVVNGQTVDSAIHLFREPPLVSFARDRKQITTVSRQLLESPLSKTDANLQLDDYLIERISHIKKSKGKISNKLLYTTIYEKAGITSRNQKMRGKEKITKYLEHYKKCGFIKDFTEAADGVTITY